MAHLFACGMATPKSRVVQVNCDRCTAIVRGPWYHNLDQESYDLCTKCYSGEHMQREENTLSCSLLAWWTKLCVVDFSNQHSGTCTICLTHRHYIAEEVVKKFDLTCRCTFCSCLLAEEGSTDDYDSDHR